jgi:hypothetical protein
MAEIDVMEKVMKKTILILAVSLLLEISGMAMAQNSGPSIPRVPMAGSDPANDITRTMLEVRSTPASMPGGLYRLGNGYLSCPESVPMTAGQPNLRSCTYIKEFR